MDRIDLNADLGESVDGVPTADDEAMFAVISSASIACGGHAGDEESLRDAVARAERFGVAIGAHPSYPDRAGFGRAPMELPPDALRETVRAQLDRMRAVGGEPRYVKPHGALYNRIVTDPVQADAVARAIAEVAAECGRALAVLGLGGQFQRAAAERGLPFYVEAFLDRGYRADGTLVPRGEPGALLQDPVAVAERAVRIARTGTITAVDGTEVRVRADSLCVHGDTPSAVDLARGVRAALDAAHIEVRAPW